MLKLYTMREVIMRLMVSLILVAMMALFGCTDNSLQHNDLTMPSAVGKISDDARVELRYAGFARNGTPIVRGNLYLSFTENGRVSGRWEFRSVQDSGRIGPQVGRGRLAGSFNNGMLTINLNPDHVDNNVILHGRFNRHQYIGRWEWVGFPGVMNSGTFRAARAPSEPAEVTD